MNVFLYSVEGDSALLVKNIQAAGHDVMMHIVKKHYENNFDGLVFKTDDPELYASQADLIIIDDNEKGHVADRWRAKGWPVWNGGEFVDKLEYDRVYGMEVFSEHGIGTPQTWEVKTCEEVTALVKSEFAKSEKVVIKVCGEGGAGNGFSFVADNPEMLCDEITHWEEEHLLPKTWVGIVQRFVEGIEVSVEAWWDGESWSNHNITIEEKKVLSGNLGMNVGCAFNTLARISPSSRLFKKALEPVGPLLKQKGYVGQIDTNSIVTPDGEINAIEFTPRVGYDAVPTLVWNDSVSFADQAYGALHGSPVDPGTRFPFAAGVRVYVLPYPMEIKNEDLREKVYQTAMGVPINIPEAVGEDFYLRDAKNSENGLVCAGTCGIIGVAMGGGDSPQAAGRAAYRVAEKVKIPGKSYRAIDGWKRAEEVIPELIAMKMVKLA